MKFARTEMLFLIWTVPVVFLMFYYGIRRRRSILSRYASPRGLKNISAEGNQKRRWTKAILVCVAVLFISIALSGPQYGYRWQEVQRKGIDIMVALDCSKSMLATDISPTRLDRAKREIFDLLHLLKGDRIGLVAFSGTAFLQCPLTLDYQAFNLFLNSLTPDYLPVGGTNLAEAIRVCQSGFDPKSNSDKAIILITDGESTGDDPIEAAKQAKADGIKIFCIGVGQKGGAPIPLEGGGFVKDRNGQIILSKLDEDTLKKICLLTDGTYVRSVAGDMDLDVIYNQQIRKDMKKTTLTSSKKQIWEDRFQWILFFAIICMAVEMFLSSRKKMVLLLAILAMGSVNGKAYAKNVYEPVQKGITAYNNGEYEKALKYFIQAQLEDPDNPDIYYNIGNTQYKLKKYDEALDSYKHALKTRENPLKQKTLFNQGNALYRQDKYKDAIKKYEDALKLDPKDVNAKQNIEFVKKMMELKKQQQQQNQNDQNKKDQNNKNQNKENQKQNQQNKGRQNKDQQNKDQQNKDQQNKDQQNKDQQNKDQNKNQQQNDKTQYGKEMPKNKSEQNQEQASPQKEKPKENPQNQSAAMGKDKQEAVEQAKRMLNRLEDKPGGAMMQQYQKQEVEKDW